MKYEKLQVVFNGVVVVGALMLQPQSKTGFLLTYLGSSWVPIYFVIHFSFERVPSCNHRYIF